MPLAGYPSSAYGVTAPGGEAEGVRPGGDYRELDMTLRPLTVLRHTNGMKIAAFAGEQLLLERTIRLVVASLLRVMRGDRLCVADRPSRIHLVRLLSWRWRMSLVTVGAQLNGE